MNLSEAQIERIQTEVEQFVLDLFAAYSTRDEGVIEQVMECFDEEIHGFGSGEHKVVSDRSEIRRIIAADMEATSDGLTADVRIHRIQPLSEKVAAVSAFVGLEILTDDSTVKMPLRYTMVVKKGKDGGWRMTQVHASVPDRDQVPGKSVPLDAMRARAEKLEQAVSERTAELSAANRELQIEAALERVRARATAMRESSEIVDVADTLRAEMQALGLGTVIGCMIVLHVAGTRYRVSEMSRPDDQDESNLSVDLEFDLAHVDEGTHVHEILAARTYEVIYYDSSRLLAVADFAELFDQAYADGMRSLVQSGELTELWSAVHPLAAGQLVLDFADEPHEDVAVVMPRMAGVFDLAYKRFDDLKKAEAQTREAQIQLALERIRVQSTSMQHSSELVGTSTIFHEQLLALGVPTEFSYVWLPDEAADKHQFWASWTTSEGDTPTHYSRAVTYDLDRNEPYTAACFEAWESDKRIFVDSVSPEDYRVFYDTWQELLADADHMRPERLSGGIHYAEAYMKYGCFGINIGREPTSDERDILGRFAVEFERAYTRFLDLKTAEAQARDAEIEAAMERVRSRAIGMQTSDELQSVADELRQQMGLLGQKELEVCAFHLYDGGGDTFETWGAMRSPGDSAEVLKGSAEFPRRGVAAIEEAIAGFESSEGDYVVVNEGAKALEFFRMLEERAPEQHAMIMRAITSMNGGGPDVAPRAFWSFADFSGGSILMVTYEPPSDDARKLLRRCADVFDLGYRRFKDLRAAERQAREEQIEAALERVRSHAMSMRDSDELLEVVLTIHRQFAGLGLLCEVFWHTRYQPDYYEKALTGVGGLRVTTIMELPRDFSAVPELATWERGTERLGVFKFDADAAVQYLEHMVEKGKFLEVVPEAITEQMIRENDGWTFIQARTTHGELGYMLWGETDPSEEATEVLIRFARVFDLAHRRYEDLRESEAAAREATIEMALERVRARTMAMQHSEELKDVAMMYAAQLDELGMDIHGAMYLLQDPEDEAWTLWTGYSQNYPLEHVRGRTFEFPFQEVEGDPSLDAWRRGDTVMESFVSPEELPEWTEKYRIVLDASDQMAHDWIRLNPEGYFRIDAYMKYGVVAAGGPRSFTEEEVDIQVRFAREFERTYRRFLDLKKAEEQAHEARIEAALERMRSRTMAMQTSDELLDVSSVMTEQLVELGMDIHWAYLYLYNEEQDELEVYLTKSSTHPVPQAKRGSGLWTYPRSFHDPGQGQAEFIEVWSRRDAFRTADFGKDRFDEWADQFQMMFDDLGYSREDYRPHAPDGIFNVEALMGSGYVGMGGARSFGQEDVDVLVRFAAEFEGTYRRFLDIQKAEAQSRESQIEAALERVRGRAMAMQHSDELGEVVDVIFRELELSFEKQICIFISYDSTSGDFEWWSTGMGAGVLPQSYRIPNVKQIRDHPMVRRYLKDLENGTPYSVFELSGETKRSWDKMLFEITELETMPEETKQAMMSFEKVFLSDAYLRDGMLEIAGPEPLSSEQAEVLQRFARVLEFSYSRMADLQKAETDYRALIEEKARTEQALLDLRATQKQLIEQEKLASLGSLTAGIAHEIKNPLNFVNNFAEVSEELMDELAAAVAAGDADEVAALLDELRQNARQIAKHGGRADSIVRSMMQHARGGASEREQIDVNTFVEEYVDLAWHGMRARDHTFQCDVERSLTPDAGTIDGQPQEIGRVVLNLLNNAFYAVGMEGAADEPVVRVSTVRSNGLVTITISDSGPGIPDDIREKIFEPFFTTKPTGEGTGLGLSLSYDIITKGHGGEMTVGTSESGGASFTINLPVGQ